MNSNTTQSPTLLSTVAVVAVAGSSINHPHCPSALIVINDASLSNPATPPAPHSPFSADIAHFVSSSILVSTCSMPLQSSTRKSSILRLHA